MSVKKALLVLLIVSAVGMAVGVNPSSGGRAWAWSGDAALRLMSLLDRLSLEMQISPPVSPEADRYKPAELAAADLRYSTYLGGAASDRARAVAIGPDGDIYLAGETASDDLPTTPGALQPTRRGNDDVFVARLDPSNGSAVYVTYLGGSGTDQAFGLAVDADGAAYVTGWTNHGSFPITPGAADARGGGLWEGFVAKLSPDGARLEYSTYLGGSATDVPYALAVDDRGTATVVGATYSADFPVTAGAYDTRCGLNGACDGNQDAFVARLNPTGTAFEYGTFIGGSGVDTALGVALHDGHVYLTGPTWSTDFPLTAGVFDPSYGGAGEGFVVVLEAGGTRLVYASYLGGSDQDTPYAIAIGADGSAYVTGMTKSLDFPVTPGAFDTTHAGGWCGSAPDPFKCRDAFITRIAANGASLVYGAYLGGAKDDYAYAIAVGPDGGAYVTGGARSANFPTTPGAFDTSYNGNYTVLCEDGDPCPDVFVAALSPNGSALTYSTFVGALYREWGHGIAIDAAGALYVAGLASADLPTTPGAFDSSFNGTHDAFALIIAPHRLSAIYLPLVLHRDD